MGIWKEAQHFPIDRHLSPTDAQLRVVEMHIGPDCVVAPLLCPNLLSRVLHLLPEPYHLKISTDGTYRLMFGSDFTLLNIGVNVKHWARARPSDQPHGFSVPLCSLGFCYS